MVSRYQIEWDKYFMIVLGLQEWIMIMKHLKMHKMKIMKINKQASEDEESNDEILGEDYDEMSPDEIYKAEQLELNNIQEDEPEPEGNNENNFAMNADEIQDEDEEPVNET